LKKKDLDIKEISKKLIFIHKEAINSVCYLTFSHENYYIKDNEDDINDLTEEFYVKLSQFSKECQIIGAKDKEQEMKKLNEIISIGTIDEIYVKFDGKEIKPLDVYVPFTSGEYYSKLDLIEKVNKKYEINITLGE